ncbi:MAG: LytTR family transcriptional regulator DNA-binding domain-containing protein [Bacteroidales bacterium]|nr:LytTR family transcriptional regulator DNA-binding domain-containing protein [Bacteroidales bacterium]
MSTYNIYIPTEKGKRKVDCSQILYVETSLQFTRATFVNNETFEILLTIKEMEHLLSGQGFFRFNNKYIVNLIYVQIVFPSDASKVILENGKEIFVDYNKKDELFENLLQVYDLHELV